MLDMRARDMYMWLGRGQRRSVVAEGLPALLVARLRFGAFVLLVSVGVWLGLSGGAGGFPTFAFIWRRAHLLACKG